VISAILQRLKEETLPQHQKIEAHLPVLDEGFARDDYYALLSVFWGYYSPVEAQIMERPEWFRATSYGYDFTARRKTPLLECELSENGVGSPLHSLSYCEKLPALERWEHVLGCLYVLEGATLGGQIIRRHLETKFDASFRFFNPYGERTGLMWRQFGAFLTTESDRCDHETIVQGANNTFQTLDDWLQNAGRAKDAECPSIQL
jgi:heme oxygenase